MKVLEVSFVTTLPDPIDPDGEDVDIDVCATCVVRSAEPDVGYDSEYIDDVEVDCTDQNGNRVSPTGRIYDEAMKELCFKLESGC